MTLSVCCLTDARPAMVAAALSPFRAVAEEILVAVDSRVDERRLGPLHEVADTILRFEYPGTPERARPWLVAQCRNDDVLIVDGDEVPSTALLDALPALVADDGAQHVRIARRWCFPDERHWLAERPWWPDLQRRLVRRGPDLDFDTGFHGGVRAADPVRQVEEPLYHLVCVVKSFGERRRAARHYEDERPGIMAVGGGPMNAILYAPEHFATTRPEPTPAEDLELLRAALHAPDITSSSAPRLPVVTAGEIAEHVPADALEAQGYQVALRVAERDLRTDPGSDTYLLVEIHNLGPAPIPRLDSRGAQVRVCTRVVDTCGPPHDWVRTPLPCDVPPGERRLVEAIVHVPAQSGLYTVEVDLLNERSRWFDCLTSTQLAVTTRWGRFDL